MDWQFVFNVATMPFVNAFVGWITTYLAIKMIFRPREPKKFLGITYQGIVPKKRHHIAMSIGRSVERNMISMDDFQDMINKVDLEKEVEKIIDKYIEEKLAPQSDDKSVVGRAYNSVLNSVKDRTKKYLAKEISANANDVIKSFVERLENEFDIQEIVAQRIDSYDVETLENVVFGFTKGEFKFLEIMGGVFGFIIGLAQAAIIIALQITK